MVAAGGGVPARQIVDPRFRGFVLANAPLVTPITGCVWLEGPVWFADHQQLLVSDVPGNRILRWSTSGGHSEDGNVWTGAGNGVHCIDPGGGLLGKVFVPATVANLTFGGRLRSRLFLCAGPTLYAIPANRRGCRWP